jgi:hypothetical protein
MGLVLRQRNSPHEEPELIGRDQYLVPQNMAPADMIEPLLDAKTTPAPAPPPEPADGGDGRGEIIKAFVVDLRDAVQRALPIPTPAPEPVVVSDPALDTAIATTQARRRATEITAQRAIIEDVVRRMLAREKGKAREAAKTPERLRAWVGGAWYTKHAEGYRANLVQPIALHLARIGSERDAEAVTVEIVTAYVEESRRQCTRSWIARGRRGRGARRAAGPVGDRAGADDP